MDRMFAPELERIAGFNRTNRDFPDQVTLPELIEARVQEHPLRLAVLCDHDKFWGTAALNYGQLKKLGDQVAQLLRERGARPGQIVGMMVELVIRHDHRHLRNHEGRVQPTCLCHQMIHRTGSATFWQTPASASCWYMARR